MFDYPAFAGRPRFVSVAAKPVNNRCVSQKWSTNGNEAGEVEFVEVEWLLCGIETLKELELPVEAGCTDKDNQYMVSTPRTLNQEMHNVIPYILPSHR